MFAWLQRTLPWPLRGVPLDRRGEAAAAKFLRRLGYHIVARRQRSRLGELDLVAVDGRTVVFVEVKTRESLRYGRPEEAVDDDKQRRVTRAALGFLRYHGLLENPSRFDVVAVHWPAGAKTPTIEHFPHAFPAVGVPGLFS